MQPLLLRDWITFLPLFIDVLIILHDWAVKKDNGVLILNKLLRHAERCFDKMRGLEDTLCFATVTAPQSLWYSVAAKTSVQYLKAQSPTDKPLDREFQSRWYALLLLVTDNTLSRSTEAISSAASLRRPLVSPFRSDMPAGHP